MVHNARNIIHTPPYGLAYLGHGLCGHDVVLGPLARASVHLRQEPRPTTRLDLLGTVSITWAITHACTQQQQLLYEHTCQFMHASPCMPVHACSMHADA